MSERDLWLPPSAAHLSNGSGKKVVVKPFSKIGAEMRRRGFEMGLQHDAAERVMRVRFRPTTAKTLKAVMAAGGDEQGLEVSTQYAAGDSPAEVAIACIDKGLEVLKEVGA